MAKKYSKSTYKRRTNKGKKSLYSKVKKIEKELIDQRPEVKFIQPSSPLQFLGLSQTNPLNYTVNVMTQGTDEVNNRLGAKARFIFFQARLRFGISTVNWPTNQGGEVRVLLVKEKTALGSALSLTQFFIDTPNPYTYSLRNYTSRDSRRFKCYYDRTFRIGVGDNTKDQVLNVEIYKKLNFMTNFSRNNLGTVQDIDTNSLSLICITNNTTASALNINWEYVMGFVDD